MNAIQMKCADEGGFPVRPFLPTGKPDEFADGKVDYACAHCGWLQTSFAAGLRELVNLATWHDDAERERYRALADAESSDSPIPAR